MIASGARPSRAAFRHDPPELGPGLVLRGRLVAALRGRFERRLTVVSAGAGFGKTTLLAQAVAENHMERAGTDVWLRVTDADRDPGLLLAGLGRSLRATDTGRSTAVDDLVEEVWARAPTSVAFVIDDAHLLDAADDAWAVVRRLLDELPANGHLVVAGRTAPPLPTARLLATDEATVVDEAQLAFTAEELDAFGTARGVAPALAGQLPPWPALAVLQSAAGSTASAAFVGDEVLATLPAAQVRLLALASGLDALDDVLVEALDPGAGWTAADVVRGVPLVQADGHGAYRLHGLLAAVLAPRIGPAERSTALAAAGVRLLAAGADRRAVEAAALAGDRVTLHRAVCRFSTRPIRRISVPDVAALADRLPPDMRAAPIGGFLDAARQWEGSAARAEQLFLDAEARAQAAGDEQVEALCTWRIVQLRYLDDHDRLAVEPRHDELAARGVPLARSTPAFVRSVLAQRRGDAAAALAALDDLDDSDPEQRTETVTARLIDLGRPEAVPAAIEDLFSPGSVDLFAAQAIWLRGEVTPDVAWAVAGSLPGVAGRAGVQHEQVSIRSLVALAALAVGRTDAAAELLDRARSAADLVGAHVRLLVTVGDALLALQVEGEAAAIDGMRRALAEVPLGRWPARPYLYALAPLRALLPEHADVLDGLDLGPSLALTVAAGRAVAALRVGDPVPARALPWTAAGPLRCHVPPPLLAELALAAGEAGDAGARAALDEVPGLRRWLQRLAEGGGPLAGPAAARLATLPARPPYDVHVRTLGGLVVERSDGGAVDEARTDRTRVRQLLAALVVRRRVPRRELAARLWPDLPADRAAANLRANLRHLQAALQPDRPADEPPWFVQAAGDVVALADEGIAVDVHGFDDHVGRAVQAEGSGLPSVALVEYRAALDLYGGDLLPGLDDTDVEVERVRLRSLAHAARCRVGELVLARGEPEAALREAAAALRLEPLSERAHRLFVRAHLAVGSTAQARAVGRALVGTLAAEGLRPEEETAALLRRIQVDL